jgi:hypothetical protein
MSEKLKEFARETIDELLRTQPPERLLKALSVDDLIAVLTPERREELVRKLRSRESGGGRVSSPGNVPSNHPTS